MGWQMENPGNREEDKAMVFAPNTLSLGCSLHNGGIWGHSQGRMPFIFGDQGPLLKGGGDMGGVLRSTAACLATSTLY